MPRPKGLPKTGGRIKGTPNRRTQAMRAAALSAPVVGDAVYDTSEMLPLEFLVSVMRNPALELSMRLHAASVAAPFLHPKLGMIDARVGLASALRGSVTRQMTAEEFDVLLLEAVEPDAAEAQT